MGTRGRAEIIHIKSVADVSLGDLVTLGPGDSEFLAEVVSIPDTPGRPLIVYRIVDTNTIGVLNLKRVRVKKVLRPKAKLRPIRGGRADATGT